MTRTPPSDLVPYFADLARRPLLTPEEELAVARRARAGDLSARARLVESNLRLVVRFAVGHRRRGVDPARLGLDDLIGLGNLGLLAAADRFDPERGVKFDTYAAWWIRQAIGRGVAEQAHVARLPCHAYEAVGRYRRAARALAGPDGPAPPFDLVIAALGLPRPMRRSLPDALRVAGAEVIPLARGREWRADPADPADPARAAEAADESAWLDARLAELPAHYARVIRQRHPAAGEPLTFEEIGRRQGGITPETVRRMYGRALYMLREMVAARSPRATPPA